MFPKDFGDLDDSAILNKTGDGESSDNSNRVNIMVKLPCTAKERQFSYVSDCMKAISLAYSRMTAFNQ